MQQDNQGNTVRLNKFIAQHLSIGRRQADTFIEQGKVLVNGKPPILGAQIMPSKDAVIVNGKPIITQTNNYVYVAFHKPVGYVCSRRQQGETPTIYALLPRQYQHLKPVGRLDKDSSGLLLLTNDGDFAHRLTHPSFHKRKLYKVTLNHDLQPLHHQFINDQGIELPDGTSRLQLERLKEGDSKQWLVTMHEGRNRQIRRTFAALGYTVTKLHRIQFGQYQLADLAPGNYQEVTIA